MRAALRWQPTEEAEDRLITIVTGSIPIYVYTPNNLVKDSPIFIYYHGGGMVVGSRENVETTCQIISAYELSCLSHIRCICLWNTHEFSRYRPWRDDSNLMTLVCRAVSEKAAKRPNIPQKYEESRFSFVSVTMTILLSLYLRARCQAIRRPYVIWRHYHSLIPVPCRSVWRICSDYRDVVICVRWISRDWSKNWPISRTGKRWIIVQFHIFILWFSCSQNNFQSPYKGLFIPYSHGDPGDPLDRSSFSGGVVCPQWPGMGNARSRILKLTHQAAALNWTGGGVCYLRLACDAQSGGVRRGECRISSRTRTSLSSVHRRRLYCRSLGSRPQNCCR